MRVSRRKNQGFTLAELLIVVAIIAVLAAIAFPVFSAQLTKAKLAVDIAHFRTMETYAGILQTAGEITIGGVTIRPSETEQQAFCFLNDGTLSANIWAGGVSIPQAPENAYLAKASSNEDPKHKEGDVLVMILYKANMKPKIQWGTAP